MTDGEKFDYNEFELDETIRKGGMAGFIFAGYLVFSTALMFTPSMRDEIVTQDGEAALYFGVAIGLGLAAFVAFLGWRIRARHSRASSIALFITAFLFAALIVWGGGATSFGIIDILVFGSTLFLTAKATAAIGKYRRTFGDENLAKTFD